MFENYTATPLFVMSRTEFAFGAQPSLPFLRMYRSAEDHVRTFGIGTSDSFTIFPAGDSQTFSYLDLILAAGERIHFDRVSRGTDYPNAKFRADAYMGSPFSQAFLQWNGNGWDLTTRDGWTFKFPSSGPDRSVRESALLRIEAGSGRVFSVQRTPAGDLQRAQAPDGSWIEFTCDSTHRMIRAKKNSGRSVEYEYDKAGRLAHLRDSESGEESYQYDPINRLTTILDARGRPLLQNSYGDMGEITSQTLADGRKLLYEYGWDENRKPSYLKLTDPHGYVIQWWGTRNGFLWSLPELPRQNETTSSLRLR
jgi:YD repeat-containing protein